MNNANAESQESALIIWSGLVADVAAPDLPEGSAAICCDMDFTVGAVRTRDGIVNVYVYDGADEILEAGLGVSLSGTGTAWSNPDNIIHDNPPNYASVTLNSSGGFLSPSIVSSVMSAFGFNGITQYPLPGWQALHPYSFDTQIVDSNGNIQQGNGTSGATVPTWNVTLGGTTSDGSVTWTNQGAAPGTPTVNVAAGDTLVLLVNSAAGAAITGGPFDTFSNTWTLQITVGDGNSHNQVWTAVANASGSMTVTFTIDETNQGGIEVTILDVADCGGVDVTASTPMTSPTGTPQTISGGITTTQAGDLIIAQAATVDDSSPLLTYTASGTFALVSQINAAEGEFADYNVSAALLTQDAATAATYTPQVTPSSNHVYRMSAIALLGANLGPPTGESSNVLQANGYGFTIPLTSSVLGVEVNVKGKQTSTDPLSILTMTPIGGGTVSTFQLPTAQGTVTLGGPGQLLGMTLTPALINSGNFGFNFQAFDTSGAESTFDLSAATVTVWYTPPGLENFDWVGTYEQTNGSVFTLALDNNGVLWQEDINTDEGVLAPIYTAIEPDTFAKGVTLDDREYIALSDLMMGTDMPRQYNGQWVDRVSQVGPGVAPTFGAVSTTYNIVAAPNGLKQPLAVTPLRAILWSVGPANNHQAGNVITIYYGSSGPSPADPNIVVGNAVHFAGMASTTTGASPNGTYIIDSVGTTVGEGGVFNTFTVQAPSIQLQDFFPSPAGSYQATMATMTLTAPAPGIQVGTQVSLSGDSPDSADWDKTWTILNALNAAQLQITSTSLTSNVASYVYTLISGTNPTAGEQVTVTGTTNGNGIFNVVNGVISAASPGSFSLSIDSPNIPAAAEAAGQGLVNGTIFQFDPGLLFVGTNTNPIFTPSGGGTVVQAGTLGAGVRMGSVMFLTRNGFLTAPAPPVTFSVNEGASAIVATNVPIGPPNVIARVITLTGANGAFFFWVPTPVTIQNPGGQPQTYSSTVIEDNVTTQVTLTLTDAVLLAAASIDSQGSNNFEEIELGSCTGFIGYSQRLVAWGEQNKVQNFNNLSFDGGYVATSALSAILPAGWTLDKTNGPGGTLLVSPLFGNSYYIHNTTGSTQAVYGMIEQNAALDPNQVAILAPQTEYGVRVTASIPSGLTGGNLVIDLFSPTFGAAFGTLTIPFSELTETMQIITANLLTTAFTTQVPPDLLYRIYATNIVNGADVEIDRTEVFDLAQPILSTNLRVSYFDNFEAFDDVTGNIGVAEQNQQAVTNAFELFDNLYAVKTASLVTTSDNGVTEPDQWDVHEVSNKVGSPSINGIDVGEGWALIAGLAGLYIFEGGKPQKISPEIDPLWQAINWKYGHTIWLRNDTDNRRILIGIPLATPNQWMPQFPVNANPTQPNVVLMCSYKELMTAGALASEGAIRQSYTGTLRSFQLGRRWSVWSIEAAYADFIQRDDTTLPIFFCGDTDTAKIYQQLTGYYFDDGNAILDLYVTYPFLKTEQAQQIHAGLHNLLATYASMLVIGEGNLNVTVIPDTLQSPYAQSLDPIELGNPPAWGDTEFPLNEEGNRFFVWFETQEPGDWFQLSRFVLTVGENPWAPVRGSNM